VRQRVQKESIEHDFFVLAQLPSKCRPSFLAISKRAFLFDLVSSADLHGLTGFPAFDVNLEILKNGLQTIGPGAMNANT